MPQTKQSSPISFDSLPTIVRDSEPRVRNPDIQVGLGPDLKITGVEDFHPPASSQSVPEAS